MPGSPGIGADEVVRKEFATSFRGFDQHEVRVFLDLVAAELAAVQERERSLEERLAAVTAAGAHRVLGDQELESALGLEMGRVLQAAREAATEVRTRSEEQAAHLLREASDDSTRMRGEAAAVLAERTAEAERAATAIREEAEREVAAVRAAAAASAAEAIEVAKERGRQMVGEAQLVRERILRDLGRRRRLGQQHLEQLRAGRDRLLEAYRGVQGALDAAMADLVVSEPEARAAAETAGLRAGSEPELTLEELEAEVVAAVDAGLVVVPPRSPEAPPQDALAAAPPLSDEANGGEASEGAPSEAEQGAEPAAEGAGAPPTVADVAPVEAPAPRRPASVVAAADRDAREQGLRRRMRKGPPPAVRVIDVGHQSEGVRLLPPEPPPVEEEPVPQPPGGPVGRDEDPAVQGPEPDLAAPEEVEVTAASGAQEEVAPKADDLFARMRAERAATVARANDVLAEHAAAPPAADAPASTEDRTRPAGTGRTAPVERPTAASSTRAGTAGPPAHSADGPTGGGAPVAPGASRESGPDPGGPPADRGTDPTSLFEQRDGVLEAHERSLARALKRALADEQNSLLDVLRRAEGVPDIDVLLPPASEHAGRYAEVAVGALGAAATDGAGRALPAARVQALASELAGELVGGLRPRLSRAVDGGGGDEVAGTEALSAAYREWKTSRIEPLARHHVLSAWAAGSFAAAPKTELQWVLDPEVGCSPDCADNVLAGPTPKGEPFPTGQLHPPAHAGCRCLVVAPSR